MFFGMRFDLGTLDSGERSLPFGLLVFFIWISKFDNVLNQDFLLNERVLL